MADALVPIAEAPEEVLRLLGEAARAAAAAGLRAIDAPYDDLAARVRTGAFGGALWPAPSGSAAALALWPRPSPVGRRALLLFDAGFTRAATVGAFLERLRADRTEGPLLAVEEPIGGVAPEVARPVLQAHGLTRVERIDCVYPADRPLPPEGPAPPGLRPLVPGDAAALGRHLAEVYDDFPVDPALFRRYPDPSEDFAWAARFLLDGELGPFWSEASFAVPDPERPGRLLAASVVNEYGGPLLSELGTVPSARRRGWARALLRESLAAVRARTATPLRLVVTVANHRAFALYRSVGFEPDEATRGSVWIDARELGLGPPGAPSESGRSPGHQT